MDNHVYQETEFVNINENNYEQPKGPIETPSPYGKKTFDIDGSCVTNDLLSKSLWLKNSISKKKLVVSALVLIGTALVVASLIYFFTDYAVLPKSGVETKEKLIRTLEDQLNQSNLKANYQNFNSQLAQSCYKEVSLLQNHTRELIQVISLQNKHINQSGATVDKLQDEIQTWMAETERMKQLEKLLTQQINETTLESAKIEDSLAWHQKHILALESSHQPKNIQLEQQEIEIKNQSQVIEAQKLTIANLSTALGLQKNLTSIANSLMLARDQEISKLNQENSKQLVVLGNNVEQMRLQNAMIEQLNSQISSLKATLHAKTNESAGKEHQISLLHDMVQEHRQKSALAIEQKEVLKQQSEYLNSTLMKVRETMWPETGACVNTGSYMCPPKNYNAPAAKICSPGYPNAYGDLNTCIYNIAVKEGSRVELRFLTFSTYSSNTYVKVYDGNSTSSPNLTERMSGNPTISSLKSIKSSGRYLTIKFAANYNYGSIGWQAEYKTIA